MAIKPWLDERYRAIEAKAKAEGDGVHWGDEAAQVNTDARARGYVPAGGEAPVAYMLRMPVLAVG